MRIIYIHQYFATPGMAGGTRSYEFAKRLVLNGHKVTVITSIQNPMAKGELKETNEDGIKVQWIPIPYSNKMNYRERSKSFIKFAWMAYRCARKIECDIVFATSTPLTVAIPGVYAARKHKVPFVFEVRDLWPEMPIAVNALRNPFAIKVARKLEMFAYQNAKHIIALSPGMKKGVMETGYPESEISVIPNFCNSLLFGSENASEEVKKSLDKFRGKKIVLYAGTFGKINNLSYLVEVAKESQKISDDVIYLIVGDGSEKEKIIKEATKNGVLNKNFFMFPQASKDQMPAFFRTADITLSLFADIKEMWSNSANKFFDGLASGRPVAINYQGWQAEILTSRNAGIVLPSSDAKRGAQLINQLLCDKLKMARMAKNALNLAQQEFSNTTAFEKFEHVLINAKG
ncbi:MAG: glycosyltransferase WbuB [Pedobacter sp.]|nr:MAG: glycosyltransferase WbuB [Pedobacter sp.]